MVRLAGHRLRHDHLVTTVVELELRASGEGAMNRFRSFKSLLEACALLAVALVIAIVVGEVRVD